MLSPTPGLSHACRISLLWKTANTTLRSRLTRRETWRHEGTSFAWPVLLQRFARRSTTSIGFRDTRYDPGCHARPHNSADASPKGDCQETEYPTDHKSLWPEEDNGIVGRIEGENAARTDPQDHGQHHEHASPETFHGVAPARSARIGKAVGEARPCVATHRSNLCSPIR